MTTAPCLPFLLALPLFLPILPLHSPSITGTTESQAQLSQQHRSQTPSLQNFNIPKRRGAWAAEQHLQEVTTTEGAPVAEGLPEEINGIGDSRKTTETETRSWLETFYACTIPGWSIPGKIWMPANQIRAISPRAHVSRELRARALQASRGI